MKNLRLRKLGIALCISSLIIMSGCGQKAEIINEEVSQQVETSVEDSKTEISSEENNIESENQNENGLEDITVEETNTEEVNTEENNSDEIAEVIEEEKTEEIIAGNHEDGWDKEASRVKVKGIYVSGPIAGHSRMEELIQLVDETELNAMVIDIKNDEGNITYKMDTPLVNEWGSTKGYIRDIDALIQKCKEKNIYLIARIVAFKDPVLAENNPQLAIHLKDGSIYRDNKGLAWVNPYEKEVWEYLREIAIESANLGFDEIQFDYIRFSTDVPSSKVNFGENAENKTKVDIITEFTEYICKELEPYNVFVAADVYGTIIDSKVDQEIVGQDYVKMAANLDYICPMVYPSHYANGVYGIKIPDAEPYRTVNAAMNAAKTELEVLGDAPVAISRVWLQSFTASWVNGHISYGPKQIREQIKGAYDAGFDEWILWNAAIKYQRDSLLTDEEAEAERNKWDEIE